MEGKEGASAKGQFELEALGCWLPCLWQENLLGNGLLHHQRLAWGQWEGPSKPQELLGKCLCVFITQ